MRSREEVEATLHIAKLKPAELLPPVHCLSFSPRASAAECCLLQLEPGLCAELEAGHSLVIRGEKAEQAVLCSKDKTYDMKIADTSNMLLFIPDCKTPEQLLADQALCNIIHTQGCIVLNAMRLGPMKRYHNTNKILTFFWMQNNRLMCPFKEHSATSTPFRSG